MTLLEHCYIDLARIPEDERPVIKHLAEKHNALCDFQTAAFGKTREERLMSFKGISIIRFVSAWVHNRKANIALVGFITFLTVEILKALGVPTEQLTPLITGLVQHFLGV